MGSFYATCSITDVSLTSNDKTYMQLILPTWVSNPHSIDGADIGCGEKGLRVSNQGAMAEFVPFGFPIEGEYYDYGDIHNIVRDKNVEMLEEFFGISIEDIFACATDDRWYRYSYLPEQKKEKEEYVGQRANWTIADNKMKHVGILTQLTVTYFKKEHYDFLSSELMGDDTYWMNRKNEELKNIGNDLKKLGVINAEIVKKGPNKKFNLGDVTAKMIKTYREIFDVDNEQSDEDIKYFVWQLKNLKNDRYKLARNNLDYAFPVPTIATTNMYNELPLNEEFAEDVKKQYIFLINMHSLYKVLRPSYYGAQENNFGLYAKFHKFSTELVGKQLIEEQQNNLGWQLEEAVEELEGFTPDQLANIHSGITTYLKDNYNIDLND